MEDIMNINHIDGNLPITKGNKIFDHAYDMYNYFIDSLNKQAGVDIKISYNANMVSFTLDDIEPKKIIHLNELLNRETNAYQTFINTVSNLIRKKAIVIAQEEDGNE